MLPSHQMTCPGNMELSDDAVDDHEWDWREHFGQPITKDDPVWKKYVQVANDYDSRVIGSINNSMDILLVFAGLFSAVATTLIVQSDGGLRPDDDSPYLNQMLGRMVHDQLDAFLQVMNSSSRPPFPFIPPEDYSVNMPVLLWYISLDCALLVAGGAVCMKIWLLEYQRRTTVHVVPYHRAILHQQCCSSLQRWHVPELGDLLACTLMFDLCPFFYGCSLQFVGRTWNRVLWTAATVVLAIYTAFLMFTTVVGIFVPSSPYRTPLSSLLRRLPVIIFRYVKADFYQRVSVLLALVAGVLTISVLDQLGVTRFGISLALLLLPTLLSIALGLRNGLKMGRISHYVPVMALLIAGLSAITSYVMTIPMSIISSDLPYNVYLYAPFGMLLPFILIVIALSHRFSTTRSQQHFPIMGLVGAACATLIALLLYEDHLMAQMIFTWISTVMLCIATLQKEAKIEEDTWEAEAIGWLISQTGDTQVLHSALACIPGVAQTPLRRQVIQKQAGHTLALLINSAVDGCQQKISTKPTERSNHFNQIAQNCDAKHSSVLAFYLTCLAEVSGMDNRSAHPIKSRSNYLIQRSYPLFKYGWLRNNWYRFLTVPPSGQKIVREHRYPRDWYPWVPRTSSDHLQIDLDILSRHPTPYIRTLSSAIKSQLYPHMTELNHFAEWPVLDSTQPMPNNFYDRHVMLVELRMVTSRAIDLYRYTHPPEPSIIRYLQQYCISALNYGTSAPLPQCDRFLDIAFVLAYVLTENNHKSVCVASLGDSILMKAARCIMSLKRRYDSGQEVGEYHISGDVQLFTALAQAVLSATERYLRIAHDANDEIIWRVQIEKEDGIDEDSYVNGMQYLEYALFQIASQDCAILLMDQITSSLDDLFVIGDMVDMPFDPVDSSNTVLLMRHLKSRASTSNLDSETASAIRLGCRILNKMSSETVAWSIALDDEPSWLDIIGAMTRSPSDECRSAAFSAILSTQVLRPESAALTDNISRVDGANGRPSTEQLRVDIASRPGSGLAKLYETMTSQQSPLIQAICVPKGPVEANLVTTSLNIIPSVIDSAPLKLYVADFIHREGCAAALASVASCDSTEMVPASLHQSAIYVFARLWKLADEQRDVGKKVQHDESYPGQFIGDIAKGINTVVDQRASFELECILRWIERIEAIKQMHQKYEAAAVLQLVEALRRALPLSSFGQPVEDHRAAASYELLQLRQQFSGSTTQKGYWDVQAQT